jgi:hypothetical protein
MRKLLLALIALVGLQVSGAHADVDFSFTADCRTCMVTSGPPALFITTPETANPGVFDIKAVVGNLGGNPMLPLSLAPINSLPYSNDNKLFRESDLF